MAEGEDEQIQVPVVWVGVEDVPSLAANQFVIQHSGKDEFILTVGQLAPPLLLGTDEQRREQARLLTFAAIKPVGRFGFTRERLQQLIAILTENLENHDRTFGIED